MWPALKAEAAAGVWVMLYLMKMVVDTQSAHYCCPGLQSAAQQTFDVLITSLLPSASLLYHTATRLYPAA